MNRKKPNTVDLMQNRITIRLPVDLNRRVRRLSRSDRRKISPLIRQQLVIVIGKIEKETGKETRRAA